MNKQAYERLESVLKETLVCHLNRFAESEQCFGVYAVAIDAHELYGDLILCVNTEQDLDQALLAKGLDRMDPDVGGVNGIRYNPAEFSYSTLIELGELQQKYANYLSGVRTDKTLRKHQELFSDAICRALVFAVNTATKVRRAPKFIAYHTFHDADDSELERLILKTVSQEDFDNNFPEVREYQELISQVDSLSIEKRARFWIDMLDAYVTGFRTRYSSFFYRQHGEYDVEHELIKIGSDGLPAMMDYLETIVFLPGVNKRGSRDLESDGAISRASEASCTVMFAMRKIAKMPKDVEKRLVDILKRLYMDNREAEGPITLNLLNAARALHTLFPKRYPEPREWSGNNWLDNAEDYFGEPILSAE